MDTKTEAVRAITDEMRRAAGAETDPARLYGWADRLDAAILAFERARKNGGNAAVMRASLQQISQQLWSMIDPGCNDDCCAPKRELARIATLALDEPARNCDVETADGLHAAFVRHCDACNPPGGCCHRNDTRGMLDANCASILKCFARFALAYAAKGGAE